MINNTTTEQTFSCNGVNKNFAIPFQFLAGEESVIKVYKITIATGVAALLVKDVDYTLDSPATTVTTSGAAFSASYQVKLKRESPLENLTEFSPGTFPAEAAEEQNDRLIMLVQELNSKISKMFTISEGNPLANFIMPLASANKIIGWNSAATALENKDPLDVAALQTAVDDLETDVASLLTRMTTAEGTLANAVTNISQLDDDLTALTSDVGTLSSQYTTIGAAVANFQDDIDDLQDQIDAIVDQAASIADHLARIIILEAYKASNITAMSELTTRVNQLEASSPISEFSGSKIIANNQAVALALTDTLGNPANDFKRNGNGTQLARVMVQIDRRTDSELRYTHVSLLMRFIEETQLWYITRENTTAFIGEPDGVDFSIVTDGATLVGQVYYTSDNMAGANYSGHIKFLGKEIPTGV